MSVPPVSILFIEFFFVKGSIDVDVIMVRSVDFSVLYSVCIGILEAIAEVFSFWIDLDVCNAMDVGVEVMVVGVVVVLCAISFLGAKTLFDVVLCVGIFAIVDDESIF